MLLHHEELTTSSNFIVPMWLWLCFTLNAAIYSVRRWWTWWKLSRGGQ
jgi:hypothetical protein